MSSFKIVQRYSTVWWLHLVAHKTEAYQDRAISDCLIKSSWCWNLYCPDAKQVRFDACIASSTKRALTELNPQNSTLPLELTDSNTTRKVSVSSLENSRYFATFLKNFRGMSSVYSISEKSAIIECLKTYEVLAENESQHWMRIVRLNNSGERTGRKFYQFLITNSMIA